jgi:uncharacterized protein (DUF3084 family)
MYGVVLIAVLAVTGGAIAYIGDRLGTKVGKRKLTIFGLRPKHTSIVVTIITGILIASSTLGILAVVSSDVRTALFGMEALKTELASLTRQVSQQNGELAGSRKALAEKNKEYGALSAKVAETAAKLKAIQHELAAVKVQRDQVAAQLAIVQQEYGAAREKAKQEIAALQQTKKELDERVNALSASKAQLQSDVDKLNQLTAKLREGIQTVREGSIVYRAGEVLATQVVNGAEPKTQLERDLAKFVYETNRGILDQFGVKDKSTNVLWLPKTEFDNAATGILAGHEPQVVRLLAAGNIVYGEPVYAHIEHFPDLKIFSNGEVITSSIYKPVNNAREAEEVVLDFLRKVNAAGIKQGMLPDPLQGTVGSIDGAQLYDAVNKVKRVYGNVQLTATARGDIGTAGPLKIEIHVQGLPA